MKKTNIKELKKEIKNFQHQIKIEKGDVTGFLTTNQDVGFTPLTDSKKSRLLSLEKAVSNLYEKVDEEDASHFIPIMLRLLGRAYRDDKLPIRVYNGLCRVENLVELIKLVKYNYFCLPRVFHSFEFDSYFGKKMCAKYNIYYSGIYDCFENVDDLVLLGNVYVNKVYNCKGIRMYDNSCIVGMDKESRAVEIAGSSTVKYFI